MTGGYVSGFARQIESLGLTEEEVLDALDALDGAGLRALSVRATVASAAYVALRRKGLAPGIRRVAAEFSLDPAELRSALRAARESMRHGLYGVGVDWLAFAEWSIAQLSRVMGRSVDCDARAVARDAERIRNLPSRKFKPSVAMAAALYLHANRGRRRGEVTQRAVAKALGVCDVSLRTALLHLYHHPERGVG